MNLRCSRCDTEGAFYEDGEVTVGATRDIKVSRARDGSLVIETGSVSSDMALGTDFEGHMYCCGHCQASAPKLEDLVRDDFRIEPGQAIYLPDGLRGIVAVVDERARTVTVEGWHEEFKWGEVQLPEKGAATL